METNKQIDGLIFNYMHFYGNVDTYKYTRNLYRREVRLIRNKLGIKSWLDAQGFRHADDTKIKARLIPARIFHYGWARAEQVMKKKVKVFDTFYHVKVLDTKEFQYERNWGLTKFTQTHPRVMKDWIEKNRNPIDLMSLPLSWGKNIYGLVISDTIEKLTGYRLGEYKNYRKI